MSTTSNLKEQENNLIPGQQTDPTNIAGYDPFDEPLDTVFQPEEPLLVLDDIYFEAARNSVSLDGMTFSYLQPPYVNFENQNKAKKKIMECYNHKLFLILYGYSGSGKTTMHGQFQNKYPDFVLRIEDFDDLAPLEMMIQIGRLVGLELMHKKDQAVRLRKHFLDHPGYMLMLDNVSIKSNADIDKLEKLRKLNEAAHLPIVFSGVQKLYDDLYDEKKLPRTCSIVSRMDEFQMKGMTRKDAGIYLTKVSEYENFMLTYPAQQALIATALNETIGGINAFVTVLGRCITMARAAYFTSDGRTPPDKARCVRPALPDGKEYPGAEIIITLPVTPEPVMIDEYLVSRMQSEYKSHFPKLEKKKPDSDEDSEPAYYTNVVTKE